MDWIVKANFQSEQSFSRDRKIVSRDRDRDFAKKEVTETETETWLLLSLETETETRTETFRRPDLFKLAFKNRPWRINFIRGVIFVKGSA